jgi:hypothetical protein
MCPQGSTPLIAVVEMSAADEDTSLRLRTVGEQRHSAQVLAQMSAQSVSE